MDNFRFHLNISSSIDHSIQIVIGFNDFHECRDNFNRYNDREEFNAAMMDENGQVLYHSLYF